MAQRGGGNGEDGRQGGQGQGPTFETFIASERERLTDEREEIFNRQQELEQRLAAINAELKAIDAYEAVKSGRPIPQAGEERRPRQARQPREGGGGRAPRGERREQIKSLLADHPDGLTRGELLERLGAKGNKKEEQSISNALTNMKKANEISQVEGGRYVHP